MLRRLQSRYLDKLFTDKNNIKEIKKYSTYFQDDALQFIAAETATLKTAIDSSINDYEGPKTTEIQGLGNSKYFSYFFSQALKTMF